MDAMEDEGMEATASQGETLAQEAGRPMPGVMRTDADARLENSLVAAVVAGADITMKDSLGCAVVAGKDVHMQDCLGKVVVAGGNVTLRGGGAGVMYSRQAAVEAGTIGVLIAPQAALREQVRVLMTGRQAALLGAAFGLTAGLLGLLFRRRR
jgi:hypothetical protein